MKRSLYYITFDLAPSLEDFFLEPHMFIQYLII